jgi:hypothetical protein
MSSEPIRPSRRLADDNADHGGRYHYEEDSMRHVSFAGLVLVAALLAAPAGVAAAGTCQLSTTVDQGHSITVAGTGFGAGATIALTQTWSGSTAIATGPRGAQVTHQTISADPSGSFSLAVDAGPGHGGTYDFSATAGGCTATAQAVAVETAGGVRPGTTGVQMTLPPTDTIGLDTGSTRTPETPLAAIGLGFLLLVLAAWLWKPRRT